MSTVRAARHPGAPRPALMGALALAVFIATPLLVPAAAAQDFPGWDGDFGGATHERRASLGIAVGKPLIFGFEGAYHFDARTSAHVGFATLGDFTALSGEVRFNLMALDLETPVPLVTAGFIQYFLADGGAETSPLVAHAALGVEYLFVNDFAAGMRLGYMEALGRSTNRAVDRYGIHDDASAVTFAITGRYLF